MAFRKTNPYLSLVNSYMIDSPQPSSINYWWNLGSLLGLCLVIQIASGIFLAMHYSSNIELAFNSVEHIMRDVNAGWLIRYIHANGASFFFICLYLHIGKALYYGSYKSPRIILWSVGVIIFVLTMATAFMGYTNKNSPKSYLNKNNFIKINNKLIYNLNQKRYKSYYINKDQDVTEPKEIFKQLNISLEDYWENLHKEEIRSQIIKRLKNKSGIYIIINRINNKKYIGSATKNNLYNRLTRHLLNFYGNKLLKKAVLKYGLNNFIFGIIEYTEYNKQLDLFNLETMYISLLLPEYNILKEAGTSIGYKHTDETIELIKNSFTEERRKKLSEFQKLRKENWSEESKNKLKLIALNRSKDYISKKGLLKISLTSTKPISLFDINNNHICDFKNCNTAAHYLCTSYKTLLRALNNKFIYIPNFLINRLNNDYINNHNDLLKDINKKDLYYLNSKNKLSKMKSGLVNQNWNTKFIILYKF